MKPAVILSTVALLVIHTAAYGQFNTIKKIKSTPNIQVDTTNKRERTGNKIVFLSETQKETHIGPLVSMPLAAPVINSVYGNRVDPLTGKVKFHQGLDFNGAADSVMVIMPGEVRKVAYSRDLGNYIEVSHGDFKTIYGHLSFVMVREKMKLKAGAVIGVTGSTGRSTGDHLHFAMKHKGKNINPIPFLDLIYRTLELNSRRKIPDVSANQ